MEAMSRTSAMAAVPPTTAREISGMHRSESGGDLRCDLGAKIRRSRSEPQLRCSLGVPRATAAMKSSRSIGMFPFSLPLKPFFDFENSAAGGEIDSELIDQEESEETKNLEGIGKDKRANWVERLLELRIKWRERKQTEEEKDDNENNDADADSYCAVGYESDDDAETDNEAWDPVTFRKFLTRVPWSETKLFSKLAFLCNMAYVIPEIKVRNMFFLMILSQPFIVFTVLFD